MCSSMFEVTETNSEVEKHFQLFEENIISINDAIMSSSTFEVTETENETEKVIDFGLEACEENGLGLSAQVEGEVPKDHTYTKDPDGSGEEEEKEEDSQEVTEKTEPSPEKRISRSTKNQKVENQKVLKKNNPRATKAKKDVSPKKEVPVSKKAKTRKDVLTEESNKSDDTAKPENSEEKEDAEDQSKSPKRGKKRKMEEKENVIDRSIVEEVQNINEGDSVTDVSTESPAKKKSTGTDKTKAKKPAKSKTAPAEDGDNQNLPQGWVRKVVVRKTGKTAGQIDIYIYSPDGIKFRSRPDVAAYLAKTKSNLKIEDFSFSKKNISGEPVTKAPLKKEKSTPAVKPKNIPEKKKVQPSSSRKGSKLLVKINFSPKTKKGKNVKKSSNKQTKQTKSSVKNVKTSGSSSKASKKRKA